MGYVLDNLLALAGAGLATYFLWSMVLDPALGPLPGITLPFVVGLAGFVASVLIALRGLGRIYAPDDGGRP